MRKWLIMERGSRLRRIGRRFFREIKERVTGSVGLTLFKGNPSVASRRSRSASSDEPGQLHDDRLQPKDAEGFISSVRAADHWSQEKSTFAAKPRLDEQHPSKERTEDVGRRLQKVRTHPHQFERSWRFDRRLLPQELRLTVRGRAQSPRLEF